MKNFYSSLVINSKSFPNTHQVFKPRYNKEFFKRLTSNIDQLDNDINQRCRHRDPILSRESLMSLKESSPKLVQLREHLKSKVQNGSDVEQIIQQLELMEDRLMPIVISIPNRMSKKTPESDHIVDEIRTDFQAKQNLVKILNHRKLSYINNCYLRSVVGPNSHYYLGIGAKLINALTSYFVQELERAKFTLVSGLCLTKSALVEAVNSKDAKEFFNDPARVLNNDHKLTTLHLTESSRESLVGILTTMGPTTFNKPLRIMNSGACYRLGSDWFDGDDKRITQSETVHALSLNPSIEQYSMREYEEIVGIIWSAYRKLELPTRLVHCSPGSMQSNEFDSHRIDMWLPSREDWIQASRVSHYRDYITVRTGMRRGHIIDSMVYDAQLVVASILENRQTELGKFIIPNVLQDHLGHLTKEEIDSYIRHTTLRTPDHIDAHGLPRAEVLTNHEQRRHLVKRNYFMGHSRKAKKLIQKRDSYILQFAMFFMLMVFSLLDWEAIWLDYIPDNVRSLIYDLLYRPLRRIWWWIIYPDHISPPPDLPYSDIDKKEYLKTRPDRVKELIFNNRGRDI